MMRPLAVALFAFLPFLNPLQAADEQAKGPGVFRGNCAFCHGMSGRGGRGPSLVSTRVTQSLTDDQLRDIVQKGIPGTGMPAFEMESDDLDALVKHIRGLSGTGAPSPPLSGDPAMGAKVYASSGCSNCHRIGDAGSVYGPELSRIGSSRSPEYLRDSVVNPSVDVPIEFEGVAVTTKAGKRVSGIRVNEDTFTLQLRVSDGSFAFFDKSELTKVDYPSTSVMPSYATMPAKDLDDLIAFLASLKSAAVGPAVTREKGIQ